MIKAEASNKRSSKLPPAPQDTAAGSPTAAPPAAAPMASAMPLTSSARLGMRPVSSFEWMGVPSKDTSNAPVLIRFWRMVLPEWGERRCQGEGSTVAGMCR